MKDPCFWRTTSPCQPRCREDRMCSDVFRSALFSCQTTGSWVYRVIGAVLWDIQNRLKCSKLTQLKSWKHNWQCIILSSKHFCIFKKPDLFLFFVSSFLFLLFASICLSFLSCFWLVCVAAVLGTCLHFLSTSDLQMNCMLRSWSTRPLVRSWTMPSMTWPLCRCSLSLSLPLTSPFLSCVLNVRTLHLLPLDHKCLPPILLCRK